jgi:anti-sigma-K factor RskA
MKLPARYRDPAVLDRLAADYLTGGMGAAASRRARRLMDESPPFRAAVALWRARLDAGLLEAPRIGAPGVALWARIQARIASEAPRAQPRGRAGGWGVRAWQRMSLGAAAVAVAALAWAVLLAVRPPEPAAPTRMVAMLHASTGQAAAVLMVQTDGRFRFTELAGVRPPAGKGFELWLLPRDGAPISLGVPRAGRVLYPLPRAAEAALAQAKGFAVSVEPPGGSPTGRPTGPVVLVGQAHGA